MPSIEWSRVNETDPSPYDQVFVMSQGFINNNFKLMYPRPVAWERKDREAVNTNQASGQWIEQAKVEAPYVSIHVEERNPAYQILFTLPFQQGRLHLRTSRPGAPDSYHVFNMKRWKLVFKTRIASKVLSRDDPKYAVYKSSVGFRDTVFELAQLYLDASDVGAGSGFDASKSDFDGRTLDADTLYNLNLFAREWLNTADDRKVNVIGLSLTSQKTSSPRNWVGTFAPAVIDYAPYPWIDPRRPTVETDGQDQNALAIMTFTDNSRRGYASLSSRGVFTDGDAAFCMNQDLFWRRYLLPVLQEVNQKTEVFPQKTPPPHQARIANVQPKYVLGKHPNHARATDSYFSWKQQTTNGRTHWTWKGNKHKVQSVSNQHQPRWLFSQEATSSTDLSFAAGGKEIHLKGTIAYKIVYFIHQSVTEWHLPLTLEAVRSGGLQVQTQSPTVTSKTVKVGPARSYNDTVQPILNSYKQRIKKMLSTQLRPISQKLGSSLAELHKLFLPGEGVFRFGTPLFNKRGDVLVDLQYSNVHAPTGRYVVNRLQVPRDPSDETSDAAQVEEQDLAAQFEHIALRSENYPEDRSGEEDDHEHEHDHEHAHESDTLIDVDHPGEHHYHGTGEDHDWDHVQHTERPWQEGDSEFEDDEHSPTKPDKGRTTSDDFDDEVPPSKPDKGRTTSDDFDDEVAPSKPDKGRTTSDDFDDEHSPIKPRPDKGPGRTTSDDFDDDYPPRRPGYGNTTSDDFGGPPPLALDG
ncbi:uncharacterized protein DSM5745_04844 [Aspergillus mulundensis]|uniref:Uncharacterized protein n=1 Tax=Aspergillus mulundensis TaxID=1810919 RepID=A0A3D8S4R6_9EURO|nr:hypothetical protein DSM5745_04844 [Aspergillus mulundensis]RDW81287.1 hypothetical protein DSM5745_04844 [Aspergillus mulundensis]